MKKTVLAATIASLSLTTALGVQAQSFTEAMKASTTTLSFRLRSETVDKDVDEDGEATANTLKTRLTYKTGEMAGFSVLAEVDNVSALSDTEYNDGLNGKNEKQVIKDPEYTDVNQMFVQYSNFDTTVKVGNQRILLDNQRHIGGVGFRQDEQTYDAISVENKSIPNLTVFLAAINNVHTITGDETLEDDTLVNINYKVDKLLSATVYNYNVNNKLAADLTTIGARFTGEVGSALYEAEYATQTQDNETGDDFEPTYYNVAIGAKVAGVTAKVGQEVLGSDEGNAAFAVPLGTNHAFNGWTDTYLGGIGANGTVDTYLNISAEVAGIKLAGQYHDYATDEESDDMGSELGFLVAKNFGDYGVSLKASQFSQSDESEAAGKVDTTKLWLTGTAKF